MAVSVEILNDSTRTVTPKFYLSETQTFVADSKRVVHTNDVLFGSGDCVPAESRQTVTRVLSIPPQTPPTFFNCSMMRLEYRIKVPRQNTLIKHTLSRQTSVFPQKTIHKQNKSINGCNRQTTNSHWKQNMLLFCKCSNFWSLCEVWSLE